MTSASPTCVANNNLDAGIFLYPVRPHLHTNVYIAQLKTYDNTGHGYVASGRDRAWDHAWQRR